MTGPAGEEARRIASLDAAGRFDHFVARVREQGEVWGLFSDGWAVYEGEVGIQYIPLWPDAVFARLNATGDWQGYEPRAVPMDAFLRQWLPGMRTNQMYPVVFPMATENGTVVQPEEMLRVLS